jgi:tetratricopeptide (TPR) repeat protein
MNRNSKSSRQNALLHGAGVHVPVDGSNDEAQGSEPAEPGRVTLFAAVRHLVDQDDHQAAEILARKVLQSADESAFATPAYLDLRLTLAFVLRKQGNFDEAEAICRDVILCRQNTLGRLSDETATSIYALARLLRAKKDWSAGEAELRCLLEEQNACLGPDHDDTLWTHHVLGEFLAATGNWPMATKAFQTAYSGRLKTLGKDDRLTQASLRSLLDCRSQQPSSVVD